MADVDYGKTILLPKTDFPRRAGLADKEPKLIKRWEKMDIYKKNLERKKDADLFVLHDGPAFANGELHIGHALNKILKDVVVRTKTMQGYRAPFVPGFDCHGLPIEWKVEEKFRAEGRNKDDLHPADFRHECRKFAMKWIKKQATTAQRLGSVGDWDNPYLTMSRDAEAKIARELFKFIENGNMYRGSKPIMWSVPEKTALAEAEIEYHDITSNTVWIKFPIKKPSAEISEGYIVIWTTTPWTLPANRGIAYGEDIDYVGLKVESVSEESTAKVGDILYVAAALADDLKENAGITAAGQVWEGKGTAFADMLCHHPLFEHGYDTFDVRVLPGDFVTTDTGTGFVHCAPSHGEDDYKLGMKFGLEVPYTVGPDGKYTENVPLFEGVETYTAEGKKGMANKLVTQKMDEVGALVAKGQIRHSYPHSWRSKAPVIFRNTPQWFISMEENNLREKTLEAIKDVKWIPEKGEKRISAMVENRGDWCVSRQRVWGVPIAIFVNKQTGEVLQDKAVWDRTYELFMEEGADAWWRRPAQDFLGNEYDVDDYEQVMDTVDVWADSGSTHGFVLEDRPELRAPADLYLEGSDQHRGWFQSSGIISMATRDRLPYKTVLTHGFIMDEKGYKMSKSSGNGMMPAEICNDYGADILRLWVVGSDYTTDLKLGPQILKGHVDVYLRIRNTLCFLLGNLNSFEDKDRVSTDKMSDLDLYILHRLAEVDKEVKSSLDSFDLHKMITTVHHLCNFDLSALYFDINKDNLYCNAPDGAKRLACQTVLHEVFECLVRWLAPVLCFTAEEAFLARKGLTFDDLEQSVHFEEFPEIPAEWKNDQIKSDIEKLLSVRRVVTGAIEVQRRDKVIRSSLEAKPVIYIEDADLKNLVDPATFAEFVITSAVEIGEGAAPEGAFALDDVQGVRVIVEKADGEKCERCWTYTDDVGSDTSHPSICKRCADVVSNTPMSEVA